MNKTGKIKISSENMMPIIKKWLYSDKDIFLREIVANGVDAITKHKKLVDMGEALKSGDAYKISVSVDEKQKTLTVEDNGVGMTADEVEKYITQIAFSGAHDFLEKYEKASGDGIIGHFGLGFYSAYMVADSVEIYTKSYKDETAVRWESDGNTTYTLSGFDKAERGTKIVMHIADGEEEFLKEATIRSLLKKYCSFMPYPIYLNAKGDGEDNPVNESNPLYLKDPKECTDEEYKAFYQETFADYNPPLFWIHLNMEYPFRLKGILYFPQVKKQQIQLEKAQVKLYCNQVFIADNIKEVIPEFLMLLNGVIDCPDIPLNVSRSFLQNDKQVQKISKHITKKVSEKLLSLYKNERKRYENCWNDIATFIKFGCIKETDFYEKVKEILLFRNIDGKYLPITSYFGEEVSLEDSKNGVQPKSIYYVSDEAQQAQYITMFKNAGLDAVVCDTYIDPHFISYIEYKEPKKCRFVRIDADIDGALKGESAPIENVEALIDAFKKHINNKEVSVRVERLKDGKVPAIVNVDEFLRRMTEMSGYYGMANGTEIDERLTIVLNATNPVVASILTQTEEKQKMIANQIYYMAMLSYKKLSSSELSAFISQNMQLLFEYSK